MKGPICRQSDRALQKVINNGYAWTATRELAREAAANAPDNDNAG